MYCQMDLIDFVSYPSISVAIVKFKFSCFEKYEVPVASLMYCHHLPSADASMTAVVVYKTVIHVATLIPNL